MLKIMISKIVFDKELKKFILDSFSKSVDGEGYIIERNNIQQRVLAPDGTEVALSQFGGIKRGSEVFIKSDLPSLIELCDNLAQ